MRVPASAGSGRALMAEAERIGAELGRRSSRSRPATTDPRLAELYESLGYDGSVAAYLRKKL